ncbi:MAG TPA: ABC transporter permease [Candidatus Methylomirabilis sp.]|nr:ABC transporter permease [Candidatus Methylomirabilis sp.]
MHWFRRLLQKEKSEQQLDSELRFHLERQIADNIAKGMAEKEARRRANLSFGGVESIKEQAREIRRANWLDTFRQDVLFAARLLRKNPSFTLAAVITLALGIGANTAIFSIVNASLLRPLPFKDSARILSVTTITAMFPTFNLGNSWPAFQLMRSQAPSLEESAIYTESEMNMSGQGTPEQLSVSNVSDGFFEELGATAQHGRLLTAGDQKPGQNQVAVLSDALWRTDFGADPSVIGRTLVLDKKPYVIVGVAARNFSFPEKSDVWTPVAITPEIEDNATYFMFQMVAKSRRGERLEQLNAELSTIAHRLIKQYPALGAGLSFNARPLLETRVRDSRTAYLILLVASTLVLLIACANLASLLLARGAARLREIAVRAALGASRGRLFRQGLVESCLIALLGGGIGMLLAAGGVRLFRLVAPPDTPRLNEIAVDSTLLSFSLATSLVAGILFGLAPARRSSRMDPNEALKQGARGGAAAARTAPQSRLGNALVVVEVALAFILLIGSALMTRTVYNLLHQNPGFRTDHLLTLDLPNAMGPVPDDQFLAKHVQRVKQVLEQVRAVPGVEAVTASDHAVLGGMTMEEGGFQVEGAIPPRKGEERAANARLVYPSYFQILGIPLVRGRDFTERDVKGAPPVAIVNETMAQEYWGTLDVLGKHISTSEDKDHKPIWAEVVGVAADNRDIEIRSKSKPEYYSSMLQETDGSAEVLVRTLADPDVLAKTISSQIWSVFPDQPITHVTTMSRTISESVGNERLRSVLLSVFAGIGFALALVGVYGVISYSVSRRIQEIGIRIALGATRGVVLQMILRQGLLLVSLGVGIGAGGAYALARVIATQFYGVKPTDPATFVAAAFAVVLVAALACAIPARRAMRVDPMVALRYE